MQAEEARLLARENCTSENQPELSDRMRAILISWLIEVHLKYSLKTETLYITVNLVDRYCQTQSINRSEY